MRRWYVLPAVVLLLVVAVPASAQQLPAPARATVPKALQERDLRAKSATERLKARHPDQSALEEQARRVREAREAAQGGAQLPAGNVDAEAAVGRPDIGDAVPAGSGAAVLPTLPGAGAPSQKAAPKFDAKKIEKEIERAEVEEAIQNKSVEDVVTFKTNFEKEVKCQRLPLDMKINLDMQDAPLEDLVKFFSCVMGKSFLFAGGVPKGKGLTVMATEPVTVYEAWQAFLSALEANNFTLVKSGPFLKIEEIPKSKSKNIPILKGEKNVPDDDSVMTVLIPLDNIDAQEASALLEKFKSPYGDLTIYQPTNTIFITDNGTTIRRILKILKELDVPGGKERIWIRQIEYAEAGEIATKIEEVFGDAKGGAAKGAPRPVNKPRASQPGGAAAAAAQGATVAGENSSAVSVSKVIADERTNQLIIMASRSSYLRIDKLIRKLDVPIEGEGAIHIYYLENADSEEVSSTLSSLVGGGSGGKSGSGKKTPKKGAAAGGAKAGGVASLLEGDAEITADKGTNSLVIQSSLKDFLSLKKVIQKLDIRRKQVYVEAVIMEITTSKDRKLGINGSAGTTFDYKGDTVPLLFGLGGLGISGFDAQQLTKGGMAVGMQGPLVDVSTGSTGGTSTASTLSIPTFGFLMQAIQSNSDVNVLSTPHILTLDNEEAEIQVGKQIPYRSSSMGGMGNLSSLMGLAGSTGLLGGSGSRYGQNATNQYASAMNPYSSMLSGMGGMGMVQRIDVDLSLKITPQVNESNYVKLKIEQSVEDVESLDIELGPTTSKRKVNNVVVVRDQQPVVIGGLMRDTQSEGVDKIPILGDIPIIGMLFRKTVTRVEKKNLLMVITPYIIDDPTDLQRIHEEKNEELRRFAQQMATDTLTPTYKTDYRKKHGALEEINQVVGKARKEREQQERMLFEESQSDTVGPAETHDIDYDPFARDDQGEAPQNETVTGVSRDPVVIEMDAATSSHALPTGGAGGEQPTIIPPPRAPAPAAEDTSGTVAPTEVEEGRE